MNCVEHQDPGEKLSYINWHGMAAETYRKGQRQRQCRECGLWFFPWEMRTTQARTK